MTFDEAIKLKEKRAAVIKIDGFNYRVFVTPENEEDFKNYLGQVRSFQKKLSDNYAMFYSRNGQFILRGLCFICSDILYRPIYDEI